jgi:hypothetical protein
MAEVKESLIVLLKLLAHSLMTALFVVAIAAAGTATTFALARICGGSNHTLSYGIWIALEVPFVIGIALVVTSQVLNQADEFFSLLRKVLKSILRALRGIRKELTGRGSQRRARRRVVRAVSTKSISPTTDDTVVRLKKTDEAA